MTSRKLKLSDLGEKKIISSIIKPLFNSSFNPNSIGDDCAIIQANGTSICLSTDKVPANLTALTLGLMSFKELGRYLAVLNISDIFAAGGSPMGLLLNLSFPGDFLVEDLYEFLTGVQWACDTYNCSVMGGDLSESSELCLSATSFGIIHDKPLYRIGARCGDLVYCTDFVGLASTAFYYFLNAKPRGYLLVPEEEKLLVDSLSMPVARRLHSQILTRTEYTVTAMDNTDGIGQSYFELAELNKVGIVLEADKLPIHALSKKVATMLQCDLWQVVMGFGADFQLVGTSSAHLSTAAFVGQFFEVGHTVNGSGVWLETQTGLQECNIAGWDYFCGGSK